MKRPEEVFTPRKPTINEQMYIQRADIEKELKDAISGTKHIIIHGESGTGKSWLYKKVFNDLKLVYFSSNLANASRFQSINKEFENLLNRVNKKTKTSYTLSDNSSIEGEVGSNIFTVFVAKIKSVLSIGSQTHYKINAKEPFEACLEYLYKKARKKQSVLVLDNFESILENKELLKELSDLILLLDDERYGAYNVKLLIVGTPDDILYYFSKISSNAPVLNRLKEITEVSRMTNTQANELIERGFKKELGYVIKDEKKVKNHIIWITDQIPQRLQEYCLILANLGLDNKTINTDLLEKANIEWLKDTLSGSYCAIENAMNSRETSVGRRNQTIYALGQLKSSEIKNNDVETIVRKTFPLKTKGVAINVSAMLAELERMEPPIIKRSPKGDAYYFCDPKYRICIRTMLYVENEYVKKRSINRDN